MARYRVGTSKRLLNRLLSILRWLTSLIIVCKHIRIGILTLNRKNWKLLKRRNKRYKNNWVKISLKRKSMTIVMTPIKRKRKSLMIPNRLKRNKLSHNKTLSKNHSNYLNYLTKSHKRKKNKKSRQQNNLLQRNSVWKLPQRTPSTSWIMSETWTKSWWRVRSRRLPKIRETWWTCWWG